MGRGCLRGDGTTQGHEGTLGDDACVQCLDYSDGHRCMDRLRLIKLYPLNMCSLLYINYTSIKPF